MGLLDKLGSMFVYRKCPVGKYHKINKDNLSCGHTGMILDWAEELQRWVPNPTKTEMVLEMLQNDEEYEIDREAREKIDQALKEGNIQPAIDYRRMIMNRN